MTKQELFEAMENIVNETVTAYKSDLDYDKEFITKHEGDEATEAIWLVRDSGTFLIPIINAIEPEDVIDAVYRNMRVLKACYIARTDKYGYTINDTYREEIDALIEANKKFGWKYALKFATCERSYEWDRIITGYFYNEETAQEYAEDYASAHGFKVAHAVKA